MSSPISLSGYKPLRRRQVRNALQSVLPALNSAWPKDESNDRRMPKAQFRRAGTKPDADFGEEASHQLS